MSTSSATAADERRSVSTTSKSSAARLSGTPARRAAPHGVAHGADDVERLLVAETPLAAAAGDLAGRAGVADVVAAAPARLEDVEDAPQRRRPEPAQRPRRQLEAVAAALQVALVAQLAFDAAQLADVVDGLPAERPLDRAPRRCRPGWRPGSPGRAGRRAGRGRRARPAHRSRRTKPIGCSPSIRWRPPHRRSGRAERRPCCSRAISSARPACRIAWPIRLPSSSRCSGVSESISRCAAAARRASESISSSRFCRVLREEVAVLLHELGELLGWCARRGRRRRACRSARASCPATAREVLRRRALQRVAHAGELRVEHLVAQQVLDLLVGLPRLGRAPLVVGELRAPRARCRSAARPARPRPSGRVSSGSGNSARRSASSAWSSSSCDLLSVPSSWPLRRSSRARSRARRRSASRPSRPSGPRRSSRFSALRGDAPASTSSPISSSASRTSYGGASGSGPPCHAP